MSQEKVENYLQRLQSDWNGRRTPPPTRVAYDRGMVGFFLPHRVATEGRYRGAFQGIEDFITEHL